MFHNTLVQKHMQRLTVIFLTLVQLFCTASPISARKGVLLIVGIKVSNVCSSVVVNNMTTASGRIEWKFWLCVVYAYWIKVSLNYLVDCFYYIIYPDFPQK